MNTRFRAIPFVWLLASTSLAATLAAEKPALPFIDDDYGKALSLAREKHVPIFAEAWAPW